MEKTDIKTDKNVETISGIFNLFFGNKLRAFYLAGSFAENYQINTSDIDGYFILKNTTSKKEINKGEKLIDYLNEISTIDLDLCVVNESRIFEPKTSGDKISCLSLKENSYLVYGEDIRAGISDIDL